MGSRSRNSLYMDRMAGQEDLLLDYSSIIAIYSVLDLTGIPQPDIDWQRTPRSTRLLYQN